MRSWVQFATGLVVILLLDVLLKQFKIHELRQLNAETNQLLAEAKLVENQYNEVAMQLSQLRGGAGQESPARLEDLAAKLRAFIDETDLASDRTPLPTAKPVVFPESLDIPAWQKSGSLPINQVVSEPPFCTPTRPSNSSLPIYLFVAGIEGSGHHALKSIWSNINNEPVVMVEFDQLLHSFGIENDAGYHYSDISLEAHEAHMQRFIESAAISIATTHPGRRLIFIDAQNSYPMGMGAGSLAHPDLLMMTALDGKLFDLRVIILQRHPVRAALSAVRRFKREDPRYSYKTLSFQARIISESLTHLNNVIPSLPCGKFMVLNFESFTADPTLAGEAITKLSGIPMDALLSAFSKVQKHSSKASSKEDQGVQELESFFAYQSIMWPLLASDYHENTGR
eukprot:m.34052 g.34052  ORF g.34052 m.34052 type:complete len:397 (-) comp43381_c0_seq1:164-1354(-)